MRESLFEVLSSGMWAIDHWVGDPRQRISADGPIPFDMFAAAIGFRVAESKSVEFVRPATKGHEGKLHHGSWGGPCALLGEGGCALAFQARPLLCRALVPGRHIVDAEEGCDGFVVGGWDRRAIAVAWLPYQDVLAEVAARIEGGGVAEVRASAFG